MYCTHCGAKLEEGSKFCTQCGAPTGHGAQAQDSVTSGGGRDDDNTELSPTDEPTEKSAQASESAAIAESDSAPAPADSATAAEEDEDVATSAGNTAPAERNPENDGSPAADEDEDSAPVDSRAAEDGAASTDAGSEAAPAPATISQSTSDKSAVTSNEDSTLDAQVHKTRGAARKGMPMFLLVVLVTLGLATLAFAATMTWTYIIKPQIERQQAEQQQKLEEATEAAGAATTEGAEEAKTELAVDDGKVHTSSVRQDISGTTYAASLASTGTPSLNSSLDGSTDLPVQTEQFVADGDQLYYVAQPTVQESGGGVVSSLSGGGIYKSDLNGAGAQQIASDNAYTAVFDGYGSKATPFGVANGKLYYTALPADQRSIVASESRATYEVRSIDLASGENKKVTDGLLQGVGNGVLAVRRVKEKTSEGLASSYSYAIVRASDGQDAYSLDEILPRSYEESPYITSKFEYPWAVFIMGKSIVAVEDFQGNGSFMSAKDIPIVKATIGDSAPTEVTSSFFKSTIPTSGSIYANYSKRTVLALVNNQETAKKDVMAEINTENFSITYGKSRY